MNLQVGSVIRPKQKATVVDLDDRGWVLLRWDDEPVEPNERYSPAEIESGFEKINALEGPSKRGELAAFENMNALLFFRLREDLGISEDEAKRFMDGLRLMELEGFKIEVPDAYRMS